MTTTTDTDSLRATLDSRRAPADIRAANIAAIEDLQRRVEAGEITQREADRAARLLGD